MNKFDMSCRKLAKFAGISPTTASRVIRGEGAFDSETVSAIYRATGHCIACGSNAASPPKLDKEHAIAKMKHISTIYLKRRDSAKSEGKKIEARDFESMALAFSFAADELRQMDATP